MVLIFFSPEICPYSETNHKYHLKTYKFCDYSNGYCSQFEMYVGNEGWEISDFGKTHDLICRLAVQFANKGYSLYMDITYIYGISLLLVHAAREGVCPNSCTLNKLKEKGDSISFSYENKMCCTLWTKNQ